MTFEIIQEEGKAARFLMNGQDISESLLSYEAQSAGACHSIVFLRLLGSVAMKVTGPKKIQPTNERR